MAEWAQPAEGRGEEVDNVSAWANLFRWLGGGVAFPPPNASDSTLHDFMKSAFLVPAILLIIGFIISAVLLCILCCHRRRPRPSSALIKPSSKGVLCITIFSFAVIIVGSLLCWKSGVQSFHTAKDQLDHAVSDLDTSQALGKTLNNTGANVSQQLESLHTQCKPGVLTPQIKTQIDSTVSELKKFNAEISSFMTNVGPLAKKLNEVQDNSDGLGTYTAVTLGLPIALVIVCCLMIFFAVVTTRGCGGSRMARCNDCCLMRLGSIVIVPCVFLVGFSASCESAFGVVSASFCNAADSNVLAYAQNAFGSASMEYEAVHAYITGAGVNPITQSLLDAKHNVTSANETLASLEKALPPGVIAQQCPGWSWSTVSKDLDQIAESLSQGMDLVSEQNIRSYYEQVVYDDVCGSVIAGLGWLVVVQLIIGLICLPVLSVMSEHFFTRWAAWRELSENPRLVEPEVYMANTVV